MGSKSRKINNARSQTIFNEGQQQYNNAQGPTELEKSLTNYQPYTDEQLKAMNYTDEEKQNLRSRAASPILSAYGHNSEEMQRRAVASGGAPNLIAALAKNTRNQTQALSDSLMGVNAGISADQLDRTTKINQDVADKKMQAAGLLGSLENSRLSRGLAGINAQGNAPPNQGFPWAKTFGTMANIGAGIGSAFLMRPGQGGGNSLYAPDYNEYA